MPLTEKTAVTETPAETPATTAPMAPMFPPGRYGRRREPRRYPRWLPAVLVAVTIVVGLGVSLRFYQRYGDPAYKATVTRLTERTDTGITVEFAVNLPAGGSATCVVRARADSGEEIAREQVEVRAEPGRSRVTVTHRLATAGTARAVDVLRCVPPGRG